MRKLGRLYVAACVLGVNVLLLLAAANAAALWYARNRDKMAERSPHIAQILEQQPELLKLIYPDLEPEQVRAMLEEIWSLKPTYELFTQFKELPCEGAFVNVDPRGFRRIAGQGPWPPAPEHFVVFVFGGSTTFGYGVPDGDAIPSHLQAVLRELRPRPEPTFVYNFGRGGYYSSQERALFETLVLAGFVPDVAVFIDGLNDFGSFGRESLYAETFRGLMASYTGDRFVSPDLIATLPLAKLLLGAGDPAAAELDRSTLPRDVPWFVVDRYLGNKKMLEALCGAYGVAPLFVWQPVQHYEYFPPTTVQASDPGGLGRDTYTRMKALHDQGATGQHFLWLADLQARPEFRGQLVYVDPFHYTSRFGRAIATEIAGALP